MMLLNIYILEGGGVGKINIYGSRVPVSYFPTQLHCSDDDNFLFLDVFTMQEAVLINLFLDSPHQIGTTSQRHRQTIMHEKA